MAKERPSRLMKLSVNPHNHTAMNEAMTDVGNESAVIRVERHEFKNT